MKKKMGKDFRSLADSVTTGMFDEADKNRTGTIDFKEFKHKI